MKNSIRITPYHMEYEIEDEKYLDFFDSLDEMMVAASQLRAFDDCYPIGDLKVYEDGHEWRYCGWQPGMVYEWYRDDEETWVRAFPQWDH